jgi:hypothetical protein
VDFVVMGCKGNSGRGHLYQIFTVATRTLQVGLLEYKYQDQPDTRYNQFGEKTMNKTIKILGVALVAVFALWISLVRVRLAVAAGLA